MSEFRVAKRCRTIRNGSVQYYVELRNRVQPPPPSVQKLHAWADEANSRAALCGHGSAAGWPAILGRTESHASPSVAKSPRISASGASNWRMFASMRRSCMYA